MKNIDKILYKTCRQFIEYALIEVIRYKYHSVQFSIICRNMFISHITYNVFNSHEEYLDEYCDYMMNFIKNSELLNTYIKICLKCNQTIHTNLHDIPLSEDSLEYFLKTNDDIRKLLINNRILNDRQSPNKLNDDNVDNRDIFNFFDDILYSIEDNLLKTLIPVLGDGNIIDTSKNVSLTYIFGIKIVDIFAKHNILIKKFKNKINTYYILNNSKKITKHLIRYIIHKFI